MIENAHIDLLKRVKENPPEWADNILEMYTPEMKANDEKYAKSHYWCSNDTVNIQDVIGTSHPDYAGESWLYLLQNGKRMDMNLPLLEQNPIYYTENKEKKPAMEFRKVDNKLYVYLDGNHRSCIAKFYLYYMDLHNLHGVYLSEYTVDREFEKAHKLLEETFLQARIPTRTEVVREKLYRKDTSGWMREEFNLKLKLVTQRYSNTLPLLELEGINELIEDSQRRFKKWVGKYKNVWNT